MTDVDDRPSAKGRGTGLLARWLDARLPEWLVRHALVSGWLWLLFWTLVELTLDLFDQDVLYGVSAVLLAAPPLVATGVCLWATPRDHLDAQRSVLVEFLIRFVTVVFGFFAWTTSIVIGASISSAIQLLGHNEETQVLGIGFQLLVVFAPLVATLIWLGLILRCCWILWRLRGWRARPERTRIPGGFLAEAPRVRLWAVGLAHPGLLLTAGMLSVITAVYYAADLPVDLLFTS